MRSIVHSAALVDAWFDTLRPEQADIAHVVHDVVTHAAPMLGCSVKWGNLMFTRERRHALAVAIYKDHANLQVFNGALLAPRYPALEGTGRGMRHLRLRYRQPVDTALLREIVLASLELPLEA